MIIWRCELWMISYLANVVSIVVLVLHIFQKNAKDVQKNTKKAIAFPTTV